MKKPVKLFTLFLMSVFLNSCGQNQTNPPQDNISKGHHSESQLKENSAGNLAVSLASTSKVPVSMVRNVKQARNGDILIVSYLGVFRYDARLNDKVGQGTSFTNLTNKISPPRFSSFWDVLEDRKGNLWFGTRDSGVYYYNGKSFQHFTTKDGLASNTAIHIYEDRAGNIWFGASRFDARLNDEVGQGKSLPTGQAGFRNFTTKDGFPSNSIRLLLEDKTGKLWFGAQGENMFVYDARLNGEVGQGKTFTVLKNKDGKAFNNVWSIIEDKKGNIWFGADGLWRYDGTSYFKVSQRGAYAIIEDKKGNIWTSLGNSILCYDEQSLSNINPTIKEIKVSGGNTFLLGILEANDGSIWVGAMGHESKVYRYDGKNVTDFKSKEGQK